MVYNIAVTPAGVMELVDVVDSKSTAGDSVPVRVRSPAPYRVFITDLTVVDTRFFVRCGGGMEIDATLWYNGFKINIPFGGYES